MGDMEEAAKAAIAALKDAKIIRTTKADWRLVAAAQAMRRKEYSDEFDAATAMGKTISQRREVEHWSTKLEELEAMGEQSPAAGDSLLVTSDWVASKAPALSQLEVSQPLSTPKKTHVTRQVTANLVTPGGTVHNREGAVEYTPPPTAGEPESAQKRRVDRHRKREEVVVRKMGEAQIEHRQH